MSIKEAKDILEHDEVIKIFVVFEKKIRDKINKVLGVKKEMES